MLGDLKNLDGELFEKIIVSGAATLKENVKTVNELNVFPIPDGDTGDNMFYTLNGGVNKMLAVSENDLGAKAKALAEGMLLNARGNSGVIISQLFCGIGNGLNGKVSANVKEVAAAFNEGVQTAYLAVVTPVEGTVLTVSRESFAFAEQNLNENSNLKSYFTDAIKEMKESLKRTTNLLKALKEAGVIDSGGAGLYYITEGILSALTGNAKTLNGAENYYAKDLDFSLFTEDSVMEFGYCTEFLLRLQNSKTDVKSFDVKILIDYLSEIGDSLVVFKTDSIVKVHVHTLTPYKVLEFAQKFGEFLTVKIENMTLQHNETIKNEEREDEIAFTRVERARKQFGVCCVASGDGIINMFKELGADEIISGGQSKNPSTEDFIEAFDKINADHVFVFPNNGNVFLAANQAAKLYTNSSVHVIESKNIGECYAALSLLDYTSGDANAIEQNLKEDMSDASTGMISYAVRDAVVNGVSIEKGDFVGFCDKVMLTSEKDKISAFRDLTEKMHANEKQFLIVLSGKSVTEEEKEKVSEIASLYKNLEFYLVDGGQDVYDFILIFE